MKSNDDEAQAKYEHYLDLLTKLAAKASSDGQFEEVRDLVDTRDQAQKGHLTSLHAGFSVFAGMRGSKLSGGQKQRIAIARAVVRQP